VLRMRIGMNLKEVGKQRVTWVERSDTHQLHFVEKMGFARLNPTY
jgi:hypothetical protein